MELNQYNEYVYLSVLEVIIIIICLSTYYHEKMLENYEKTKTLNNIINRMLKTQQKSLDYAKSVKEISTKNERNRLASELHDSIGYSYTNLKMILEACKDLLVKDREKTKQLLEIGLDQVSSGLIEVRNTLYQIRKLETPTTYLNSINQLINVFQKTTGINIAVHYTNMPYTCNNEIGVAFYHVIRESLVNALLHGNSTAVSISFWSDFNDFQVIISDNGKGSAVIKEGLGLLGMQERIGRIGGTLNYYNTINGFEIKATIPKEQS
ncbi:histidine kinase [Marispirochaeta sp.]|uniref:sensor histidine kinase n=1 Tax=Marispirochaeta sp. TaxID=2038653 RepID=UPI0029C68071|nr:histidine kinase [Marispirochaeta sp.]